MPAWKFINPFQDRSPGGYREFFSIAYPLVISNLSITLMHFVDRLFLSWSSTEEIAASMPAGILFFTLIAFFLGISEYTTVFVAQFYGAKRYRDVARVSWQGIYFSLVAGVFCLALMPVGTALLRFAGHPPEITRLEVAYFQILWCGAPFMLLSRALSGFFAGRGKTSVVMSVNVFINCLNGVLDYALIFGVWGFPQWGIEGAAIATVSAQGLGALIFTALFLLPRHNCEYGIYANYQIQPLLMKRLIHFGVPSGLNFFIDISGFTVFVFLIGTLGVVELASSNIVIGINMLTFIPMEAVGVATATLVGQYIGRNDRAAAEKSVYTALKSAQVYMAIFAIIYVLFPETLMRFFESDPNRSDVAFQQVVEYGKTILLFVAFYQIADASILVFTGALRGAGDTAFIMRASGFFSWGVFVPGTWIAVQYTEVGVIGVWLWASLYIATLGLVYYLRFRSGQWKKIEMLHDDDPNLLDVTDDEIQERT